MNERERISGQHIMLPETFLMSFKFGFLFHRTCVRPVVVYGGVNTGYQLRELSRGCSVLCGTPGRMLDVIERGKVSWSSVYFKHSLVGNLNL